MIISEWLFSFLSFPSTARFFFRNENIIIKYFEKIWSSGYIQSNNRHATQYLCSYRTWWIKWFSLSRGYLQFVHFARWAFFPFILLKNRLVRDLDFFSFSSSSSSLYHRNQLNFKLNQWKWYPHLHSIKSEWQYCRWWHIFYRW